MNKEQFAFPLNFLDKYNDLLLPSEVQEILMTGRNTVYSYLADGTIKSLKIGGKYRIPKLYLLEFIYPDINVYNDICYNLNIDSYKLCLKEINDVPT